jgi:hypothetical protein
MAFRTYTDDVLIDGDNVRSYEAAEAVSQGQLVEADTGSAGRTVEPSDADGGSAVGFALHDASSGDMIAVAGQGCVVRATSGTGSIASGEYVASHGASGEEGELATAVVGDYVVGFALSDDAGTNDDVVVEVILGGQPNA